MGTTILIYLAVIVGLTMFRVIVAFLANNGSRTIFWLSRLSILVLLVSMGLAANEWYKLSNRNSAYKLILEEAGKQDCDFNVIVKNTKKYFDNGPYLMMDLRYQAVKKIYREEYAKWFVQTPGVSVAEITDNTNLLKKMND